MSTVASRLRLWAAGALVVVAVPDRAIRTSRRCRTRASGRSASPKTKRAARGSRSTSSAASHPAPMRWLIALVVFDMLLFNVGARFNTSGARPPVMTAERNGATIDVHPVRGEAQLVDARKGLGGKRLVQLDEVQVVGGQPGHDALELADRTDRVDDGVVVGGVEEEVPLDPFFSLPDAEVHRDPVTD